MKRIGITGEGKMGTNIFYYLTLFDYPLTWIVSNSADTTQLEKTFRNRIRRNHENELISEEKLKRLETETVISADFNDLAGCDMVIEAVSENIQLKKFIFKELDQITSADCILASNSSSILPSDLVPSEERRNKTVGLHFFYPVGLKNIVEFIRLKETSSATINKVTGFLQKIDRNFVTLLPENAFMLNRIFLDLQKEAFSIVTEELATTAQVDHFVKTHITPAGVFEFCDHVGNDIMLASVINYIRHDQNKDEYMPFMLKLNELVSEGKLGRKAGQGFYHYKDKIIRPESFSEELQQSVIRRLMLVLDRSVEKFSEKTGFSDEKIRNLMKEYF